jgi:pimeloyl-ACP methyl ester carboxylesterase
VSVPGSIAIPRCARRTELEVPTGPLAALESRPDGPVAATAVLVPGFTGSKEDFLPLLDQLAAAGVRAFALDLRGQYESPGLPDPDGYSIEAFGADLRAVLGLIADGSPIHLLGHSFGGHAVREALLGGDVRSDLRSLTLLCSGPAGVIDAARARTELFLAASEHLTLQQIHELEPVNRHPDAEVQAFLLRRWLANDPASLRAMARSLLGEPDRTEELRALLVAANLPCLVVTGVDEDVWPAELQRTTAERLGARFAAIPDAGHSPNTQQPEATANVLLDFWLG